MRKKCIRQKNKEGRKRRGSKIQNKQKREMRKKRRKRGRKL